MGILGVVVPHNTQSDILESVKLNHQQAPYFQVVSAHYIGVWFIVSVFFFFLEFQEWNSSVVFLKGTLPKPFG